MPFYLGRLRTDVQRQVNGKFDATGDQMLVRA